jgi:hypothetical protein
MLFARAEATHMAAQATSAAELTNHFHVSRDAKMGWDARFRTWMAVITAAANATTAAHVHAVTLKGLNSDSFML